MLSKRNTILSHADKHTIDLLIIQNKTPKNNSYFNTNIRLELFDQALPKASEI